MSSLIGRIINATKAQPPVAYTAAGWVNSSVLHGGSDPENYMRAYSASGTVYSIVSTLARSAAKVPWHLYRSQPQAGRRRYTTGDQGSDQRKEIVKHLALSVWNKPNPFMTGRFFRELSQTYLDLTGECYWIIARDPRASFPTAMWPVRPDRMEPVPSRDEYLSGYAYRGPQGELVPLSLDDVIMIKYPNPLDMYHGLGPVQAILVDIDAGKYSAAWNRNFFLNSATPGGVVEIDKRLSDDEWNEWTNRWREGHRGLAAAHRVAILEQGATWVPNAHTQRDMDFVNLRNISRDVIREAFRMHKMILGTTDDVNRSNAQTAQELFEAFQVTERVAGFKETLNVDFLPLFGSTGDGVEFDFEDPISENRESAAMELGAKATAVQALVAAGYDRHAVLEVVGLPDMAVAATPPPPAGQVERYEPPGDELLRRVLAEASRDPKARTARTGRRTPAIGPAGSVT
jgi:HK97 family phage portal protein